VARGKMAAYEERKAAGFGHFIDRERLAKDENRKLGDILSSNVPGLTVFRGNSSKSWAASGRNKGSAKCAMCRVTRGEMLDPFDIAAGAPLACYLDVYLDGAQVYNSSARGSPLFNLASLEPREIEAVEVYTGAGQIPAQYNKTSGGCGVMLIWTRTGR
jgi:TonB-dependent Receptor Plug Domain